MTDRRPLLRQIFDAAVAAATQVGRQVPPRREQHRHAQRVQRPARRLERGERGRITPKVMHDRVELDLPLTLARKAS